MDNGRFGPIRSDDKPKKQYRVDYNRLITCAMVVVIIVLAIVMVRDQMRAKERAAQIVTVSAPPSLLGATTTAAPTLSPEELRPLPAAEGLLPIFQMANTGEKRIAITVDECSNAEHIATLVGLCATFDARLTFFPSGSDLTSNMSAWPTVLLGGHQIENHTYANSPLALMSADEKADEVGAQTSILRSIIGSDYQPHFLRTNDPADDNDPELHAYLISSGYKGIARWAVNTPRSFEQIEPGQILAYTLDNAGAQALSAAIKVLAENGYEMVTLNELFSYPDNIESTEESSADE